MSKRHSKGTKSYRERRGDGERERRQADMMAERLGAGTDYLYAGGNIICPLCGIALDCSKRLIPGNYQSPAVADHGDGFAHIQCPNNGKAWLVPRTYCQPIPQADIERMRARELEIQRERMKSMQAAAGQMAAGQQQSLTPMKGVGLGGTSTSNTIGPCSSYPAPFPVQVDPVTGYTYTYKLVNGGSNKP